MAAVDIELALAQPSNSSELAELARDGNRVAGFAIMEFGVERAHLVLLAVRPSHHRNGVARRLIEWLVESAVVAGMASIHVELRTSNAAAFAFYRTMGFAPTIRMEGYYRGRESAVRMLRLLRSPNP